MFDALQITVALRVGGRQVGQRDWRACDGRRACARARERLPKPAGERQVGERLGGRGPRGEEGGHLRRRCQRSDQATEGGRALSATHGGEWGPPRRCARARLRGLGLATAGVREWRDLDPAHMTTSAAVVMDGGGSALRM